MRKICYIYICIICCINKSFSRAVLLYSFEKKAVSTDELMCLFWCNSLICVPSSRVIAQNPSAADVPYPFKIKQFPCLTSIIPFSPSISYLSSNSNK